MICLPSWAVTFAVGFIVTYVLFGFIGTHRR